MNQKFKYFLKFCAEQIFLILYLLWCRIELGSENDLCLLFFRKNSGIDYTVSIPARKNNVPLNIIESFYK